MKLVGSEQDILFLQDAHQLLLSKHKDDIEKLLFISGWKETQIKAFIYLLKSICFEINEKELSLLYGVFDRRSGGALSFRGDNGGYHWDVMSQKNVKSCLTKLM